MLDIDGSMGEGGGQILRTSLSLAIITGTPVRIRSIRKGRRKPGLARQHLACVQAAATLCDGSVEGAALGSTEVILRPGSVRPGAYRFDIGTAGSTGLLLQTVLPPLMLADAPSTVHLTGGTHNPMSPPFPFLAEVFAPLLGRMGPQLALEAPHWGFYPAGGGEVRATITPARRLVPVAFDERGPVRALRAEAIVSALPRDVARRELDVVKDRLDVAEATINSVPEPRGPGNALLLRVDADVPELFTGFGERGVRAEAVADRLCGAVSAWLEAEVPVGPHLADQLLLPMALAGEGRFRTVAPDPHLPTNAAVIEAFLGIPTRIREVDGAWTVRVGR